MWAQVPQSLGKECAETENLWSWCHQVAQRATVRVGATSTSFSPLHLSSFQLSVLSRPLPPSPLEMAPTSTEHRASV